MKRIVLLLLCAWSGAVQAQYMGTGSVTQGPATPVQQNLYQCPGGRVTNVGSITASDNTVWTVPAATQYTNAVVPFASDLYNACNGHAYANTAAALAALNGSDIVTIDPDGELVTAFVFADNYFELFINGINTGKDRVPYTEFNSSIVRFRVKRPFTIAMHLVDWEEHLGLGMEVNGPAAYHAGDGGMVAVFRDSNQQTLALTDASWKAQTFYTAPIRDLTCPTETGALRLSDNCSAADTADGSSFFALHWPRPPTCFDPNFDDSAWPAAEVYSNAVVGVNNKPAYTNFTDLFDSPGQDAAFIWSSNLILDNEVVVRYHVGSPSGLTPSPDDRMGISVFPNPASDRLQLRPEPGFDVRQVKDMVLYAMPGTPVLRADGFTDRLALPVLAPGVYILKITTNTRTLYHRINIQ